MVERQSALGRSYEFLLEFFVKRVIVNVCGMTDTDHVPGRVQMPKIDSATPAERQRQKDSRGGHEKHQEGNGNDNWTQLRTKRRIRRVWKFRMVGFAFQVAPARKNQFSSANRFRSAAVAVFI